MATESVGCRLCQIEIDCLGWADTIPEVHIQTWRAGGQISFPLDGIVYQKSFTTCTQKKKKKIETHKSKAYPTRPVRPPCHPYHPPTVPLSTVKSRFGLSHNCSLSIEFIMVDTCKDSRFDRRVLFSRRRTEKMAQQKISSIREGGGKTYVLTNIIKYILHNVLFVFQFKILNIDNHITQTDEEMVQPIFMIYQITPLERIRRSKDRSSRPWLILIVL